MIQLSGFGDEISPDLEIQMDILASEGISYIDLRSVRDKNILKLTDEEIFDIKKRLDARGFKVASIASPIGKISITDDFASHLKDFMRAIHLAKYFKTPYIRIFSFYIPKGEKPYKYREQVLRQMKELTRIAENEGIILVLENEKNIYGDNGARTRDILEHVKSPHLRFVFDPANFIQVQVLPMTDAYPYVKNYIDYIHIKDARINTDEVVPAGEGDGELRKLIFALKERNYSGFMSIEPHLEAKGKYHGFSKPQLFVIAAKALKKLLIEAGVKWSIYPNSASEITTTLSSCVPVTPSGLLDFWLPLTPLEEMEKNYYDVLIVGSGAGGGAALWRLCDQWRNDGKKIGMIEAGKPLLPTHASNLAILSGGRARQYISNPEITRQVGKSLPQFSGAEQIIALGGRTLQWGAATPRMPSYLIRRWPVTTREMEFYYNIAEQVMNVNKSFYEGGTLTQTLLNRLWTSGLIDATATPMAADINPTRFGVVRSNLFFSSILFLAEALNRMSYDLTVQARAVQILAEKGRAIGVKVMTLDKKTFVLHAKNIILSTSTLETPRLLLHSGIDGKAIGHYLIDHSALRASGTLSRKESPEVFGPLGILVPNTEDRPYQFQIFRGGQPVEDIIHGYGTVEPRYENKIFLDPHRKDEYGVPEIQIHYSYSQKDLDEIQRMALAMKQIIFFTGLTSGQGHPEICLRPPGDDNQESGTCRMGNDPTNSAVNRNCQIHGISGLYVADNSILPSLGANPTLTTVAFAIRTADYIIHQLK